MLTDWVMEINVHGENQRETYNIFPTTVKDVFILFHIISTSNTH